MKVHELRTILDHLPDDLPVHIAGGRGSRHIGRVDRHRRSQIVPGSPASIRLEGRVLWFDPEPDFVLAGPFQRRDELLTKLDPDVPIGADPA